MGYRSNRGGLLNAYTVGNISKESKTVLEDDLK